MDSFNLKTLYHNQLIKSSLIYWDKSPKIQLEYSNDYINLSYEDKSPFLALVKIRLDLEHNEMLILCNGSRRDVYPSGMSIFGLMAYELTMGMQATNLVNIFEPCDNLDLISSVQDQKKYRDDWLNSLKK